MGGDDLTLFKDKVAGQIVCPGIIRFLVTLEAAAYLKPGDRVTWMVTAGQETSCDFDGSGASV
jgi:hypothetical protein